MDLSWIWGHHFFLMCWKVKIRSNMKIYEDRHEAYKSTWLFFLTCCSLIPWLMFFFSTKKIYWVIHRCFFSFHQWMWPSCLVIYAVCHLQFSERTVDPDGEGVEQPHRSKKVKVTEPEAGFFFPNPSCEKKIQIKQISLNTTHAKYDVQITTYKV